MSEPLNQTSPTHEPTLEDDVVVSTGGASNSLGGKLVILLIFGATLVMAIFAVWYRSAASRRAREAFGIEHAQRIQLATEIYMAPVGPEFATVDDLASITDDAWTPTTKVSGMTHVQGALMEDRSFAWDNAPPCQPVWEYVFRFVDADGGTTHLALDMNCNRLQLLEAGQELCYSPMATFMHRFVHGLYGKETDSD